MHGKASAERLDVSVVFAAPAGDVLEEYEDYLTRVGCRVAFANDSDTALAQALSLQPDVIAVSHRLRPLDGPQVCARLKGDVRTAGIPVIMLTTTTNVGELRAAHDTGCDALLTQPVAPEDLLRTMRGAVVRAKRLVAPARLRAAPPRRLGRTATDTLPAGAADMAPSTLISTFDIRRFLDLPEGGTKVTQYRAGDAIYTQGDRCDVVLYVRNGVVKLSVVSTEGREAVVGLVGPGEFFGEGCLSGQPVRIGSATAVAPSTILRLEKGEMQRLLHQHRGLSDRFIAHMLARNSRVEADLVDQLFNSSEKRLARALLLLARYGKEDKAIRSIPRISQSTLAEMVGTTRSRINHFMKKFERLGFIDYKDGLKVNKGLLTIVLHD